MGARHKVKKASNSSLYREIESLTTWLIGVGTRIPKNERMLQVMADNLMRTLLEAQAACASAFLTAELVEKREYLSALRICMTMVQSTVKTWFEWSSQQGQSVRILTPKQHAHFLRSMTRIGSQMQGWAITIDRQAHANSSE